MRKALESAKDVLASTLDESFRLAIYLNEAGQILLSPEVSVPMHELWLDRDPKALKIVIRGLEKAREAKLSDLGSFKQYADDAIEQGGRLVR